MDRVKTIQRMDAIKQTIAAGLQWDAASGHDVYRFSAQYRTDMEVLRLLKKSLSAMPKN